MRAGELLLHHRWVEWEALALAIDDHVGTGVRLVSFLVARGAVDFDDGSRVLGEQLGVSAALRRHLERRDRSVAGVLPVVFARRRCALPLGRLSNGTLIICVRDPSEALHSELVRIVGGDVVLAVAPAKYLERLVGKVYPPGTSKEMEISFDEPEEPAELTDFELDDEAAADGELDVAIEIELSTAPAGPARAASRALPVEFKAPLATSASRDPLDAAITAYRDIDEIGWLLDVTSEYVSKRWRSSLLFEVRGRRAVGVRGHGPRLKAAMIKTFVLDLDDPSIVARVVDERRPIDALSAPPSADDSALAASLLSGTPYALPLLRADAVAYVLVVGDPITKDPEETEIDLGLLAEALGDALDRIG